MLWQEDIAPYTADGDEAHHVTVETVEDDFYLTFSHEMRKDHYFNFVAYVDYDRVLLIRLYPEQGGEVRFPKCTLGRCMLAVANMACSA